MAFIAVPSCRWKLLFPNHMTPPIGTHSSSPQIASIIDYHQYFHFSPCRPLFNNFSLLFHQSSTHPSCPRGLCLQPYCSASVPTISFQGGTSFTPCLLRNKATMRTEISRGAVPRPYAHKVLEQGQHVWGWSQSQRSTFSFCVDGGTEMTKARHTHHSAPWPGPQIA